LTTAAITHYVFFALKVAIIASTIAMFVSASRRAFWKSVVSCEGSSFSLSVDEFRLRRRSKQQDPRHPEEGDSPCETWF
jgi:hypothetical protein